MVKIIVGNLYTKIVGFLPEEIQTELNDSLSYKLEGAKFIPSVKSKQWDGVIRLYYKAKGQSFFTGLLALVRNILKKRNIEYEILDRRERPLPNYPELQFIPPPNYQERDYQDFTIKRSLQFTRGILAMCTGAGKTITITKLISEIKTYPFIFYVLTKDLMEQAHAVLSEFLNQPIGMIGDGKCDIKKITVCTIQTAIMAINEANTKFKISDYAFDDQDEWDEKGIENAEKAAKIRKLINISRGVYVDECVSGDAKITTEIGEVTLKMAVENKCRFVRTHDGNNIIYKRILNWWDVGERDIFKIQLENGREIKCTKNHLICTQRGWIKASKVLKSDSVLFANAGVELSSHISHTINISQDNMFSDIKPVKGLGQSGKQYTNLMSKHCRYVGAGAESKYSQDTKHSINLLNQEDASLAPLNLSKDTINNQCGSNIIFNQPKKKHRQSLEHVSEILRFFSRTEDLKITDCQPIMDLSNCDGWSINQRFYRDTELSYVSVKTPDMEKNGFACLLNVCHLSQKLLLYYMLARKKLSLMKYWTNSVISDWHGGSVMMEVRTRSKEICSCIYRDGKKRNVKLLSLGLINKDIHAPWSKTKDVIGLSYPSENSLLSNYQSELESSYRSVCNIKWQQVKNILISERERVYDIEVEDVHCFFANGIMVHNCHHAAARTVKDVLLASPNAYWRFGGSATPNRESGDDIMIQALLGSKIVEINASYLIKKNWLVKPYVFFEPIEDNTTLHSYHKIYEACVAKNDKFNTHVADTAKHLISRGLSVLILVQQYAQGNFIKTLLPDAEFVTGKVSSKKRTEMIEDLRQGKTKVLIATSLADEGLDIPNLDAVLIAGGGKSSTRLFQRIGRTLRKDREGRKDKSIVVIYEHDAKHLFKHTQKVRSLLKREPEFVIKNSSGPNFLFEEMDVVLGFKDKQSDLFNT